MPSQSAYDWLGHGIYCWEANPARGFDFAQEAFRRRAPSHDPRRLSMILGAFLFNYGNHIAAWRHPGTPPHALMDLGFYTGLAQTAERGRFDFVFHSDGLGINDEHPEILAHTVTPRPEPLVLLAALAAATTRIGLIATVSTSYNEPYAAARKLATLDHLSQGRAGINVVTSTTWQEAANFGASAPMEHDARYRRAAEFVDVLRGLWDTWEDGAIHADQASGVFADPVRIHTLDHHGEHFNVRGPLNVPRPPQGHPVLVQAGVSPAGQDFAAAQADLMFTVNTALPEAIDRRTAMAQRVAQAGRPPGSVKILPGLMPVLGGTEAEARREYETLQSLIPAPIAIPYLSDVLGHDLSPYPPDGPMPDLPPGQGEQGRYRMVKGLAAEGLTLAAIAHRMLLGRGHWTVVGTPDQVADEMERWLHAGACDGFNILAPHHPGGLDAFVDGVVPILQRRGLLRRDYEGRTLRDHLGLARPPNRFA